SEETTIHSSGYIIARLAATMTTCFRVRRTSRRGRGLGVTMVRAGPAESSAGSAAGRLWRSVIVEHPELGDEEVDGREDRDDDQQQPRHRRGVTHVELGEALLVQVQREEHRRVRGAAGAPGDHERLGEGLERVDD